MSQFNMGPVPAMRAGTATVTKQDETKLVWFEAPMPTAKYVVVPHADGLNTTLTCEVVSKECFRIGLKPKVDGQVHWVAVEEG